MEIIMPEKKYLLSYQEAIKEYQEHDVKSYCFLNPQEYDVIERAENSRLGKNLPEGVVAATYLWLVDGDTFIGQVSIRHELTDGLRRFGGNIGYGIRYSAWNKGYGSFLLSQALLYAKDTIKLQKVLLTCNDDNIGSARVIEKNGGELQDKIKNTIGGVERITRRYWITLS